MQFALHNCTPSKLDGININIDSLRSLTLGNYGKLQEFLLATVLCGFVGPGSFAKGLRERSAAPGGETDEFGPPKFYAVPMVAMSIGWKKWQHSMIAVSTELRVEEFSVHTWVRPNLAQPGRWQLTPMFLFGTGSRCGI